ncbi:MAG: ABC transporter ATP-binding protein [Candidatus Dormibacteraceae bacterium]
MTEPAVRIVGLVVDRGGREILHGLTFSIARGSITGFIGPSGCGKSTLMRSIVGVQVVRSGEVRVLGLPAGSSPLRRRVGYSTQLPAVYADLTVTENARYFAAILGAPRDHVDQVIDAVQLSSHRHALVVQLSGGQITRASLAVALLGTPELLVLDEPTVGLDPVTREDLWQLFRRLRGDGRLTLLISSHVMDEAARCESLLLMRDGAVVTQSSPDELRRRTGTDDLEQAFLRLVSQPAPVVPAS